MAVRQTLLTIAVGAALLRAGDVNAAVGPQWEERSLALPIVGRATVYIPKTEIKRVALFVSGDGGWNGSVVETARRLAADTLVVGLSYPQLRRAAPAGRGCWMPSGDLEVISHAAQKRLRLKAYLAPILIGYSSGATLVYAALAGAPPVTFGGGVSMGFCPSLSSSRPMCHLGSWRPSFDAARGVLLLAPSKDLQRDWYVFQGRRDSVCSFDRTSAFVRQTAHAHLIEIPEAGHGFKDRDTWRAKFDIALADLWSKIDIAGHSAAALPLGSTADLDGRLEALNLPLSITPLRQPKAYLVFLSGDGGWASLDEGVADYLRSNDIGVIGVSSLRYFWNRRTPNEVTDDLKKLLAIVMSQQRPVFMGGYSFGAEVAPVVLQSWSIAERAQLAGLVLIAPGRSATFEIEPLDWIRHPAENASAMVAPAVRMLNLPTLCVAGSTEDPSGTSCDELTDVRSVKTVRLPGSHHFEGNYEAVGRQVAQFIRSTSLH